MELAILDFIQSLRNPIFDKFFEVFTTLGNYGEVWIIIILLFMIKKETRKIAMFAVVALLLEVIVVEEVLKPIFIRERPFVVNPIPLIIKEPSGYSFPSGHAASAFAVTFFLFLNNVRFKNTLLILAGLMAFSRLYVYVHYPTDVLAGILIGMMIAVLINYFYKRSNKFGHVSVGEENI